MVTPSSLAHSFSEYKGETAKHVNKTTKGCWSNTNHEKVSRNKAMTGYVAEPMFEWPAMQCKVLGRAMIFCVFFQKVTYVLFSTFTYEN
jgi:hypothetical protein